VQLRLDPDGRRRVQEIVAVPGRVEEGLVEVAELFTRRGDRLERGTGYPPHPDRFERAGLNLPELLAS